VLFDEMEKAHPDVSNVLLQVLDDGRLTDGQGRTVDFTNTIIVMTSNIGSAQIIAMTEGGALDMEIEAHIMELLKKSMRPELLNRIDETIIFHQLTKDDLVGIVDIQTWLHKRLADRAGAGDFASAKWRWRTRVTIRSSAMAAEARDSAATENAIATRCLPGNLPA
jgi:ATP-dependent Clp protease ATP-binding subunit ClpB